MDRLKYLLIGLSPLVPGFILNYLITNKIIGNLIGVIISVLFMIYWMTTGYFTTDTEKFSFKKFFRIHIYGFIFLIFIFIHNTNSEELIILNSRIIQGLKFINDLGTLYFYPLYPLLSGVIVALTEIISVIDTSFIMSFAYYIVEFVILTILYYLGYIRKRGKVSKYWF